MQKNKDTKFAWSYTVTVVACYLWFPIAHIFVRSRGMFRSAQEMSIWNQRLAGLVKALPVCRGRNGPRGVKCLHLVTGQFQSRLLAFRSSILPPASHQPHSQGRGQRLSFWQHSACTARGSDLSSLLMTGSTDHNRSGPSTQSRWLLNGFMHDFNHSLGWSVWCQAEEERKAPVSIPGCSPQGLYK